MPRILVAGIGNVFLGDDGFGVEVARKLAGRALPEGVRVVDFGIRGLDLAFALLDGYDAAVLVDLVQRGGEPGTLYVVEPEVDAPAPGLADPAAQAHSMDPARVLALVHAMGGNPPGLRLVGCEPGALPEADNLVEGLSPAVSAAVEPAVSMVEQLVRDVFESATAAASRGPASGRRHA